VTEGFFVKILYVSPAVFPSYKASLIQVLNTCIGFHDANYDITLYAGRKPGKTSWSQEINEFYGVEADFRKKSFKAKSNRFANIFSYILGLCKVLLNDFYDVVYTRSFPMFFICILFNKKSIFEVHDFPNKRKLFIFKLIFKIFNSKNLFIASPSKSLLRYYKLRANISCNTLWVPHGSSHNRKSSQFNCYSGALDDLMKSESGGISLAYVGSIGRGKGYDFLVKVANKMPHIKFNVSLMCDSEEIKEDIRSAAPRNVNIEFNLDRNGVLEIYKKSSVLLLPVAKYTGKGGSSKLTRQLAPLRAYEYLAAEKPIICSCIWPNREVFKKNGPALFLPIDESLWVEAINYLNSNRLVLKKMSQDSAYLNKEFSWEQRAKTIVSAL